MSPPTGLRTRDRYRRRLPPSSHRRYRRGRAATRLFRACQLRSQDAAVRVEVHSSRTLRHVPALNWPGAAEAAESYESLLEQDQRLGFSPKGAIERHDREL